ncbi:MAG: hypothetical protein RBR71_13315 [Gudongella sp.]|jgi:DNA-binding HxlR family transcriptional regulator|nr:hypothetical protein [Gudongella sp.]
MAFRRVASRPTEEEARPLILQALDRGPMTMLDIRREVPAGTTTLYAALGTLRECGAVDVTRTRPRVFTLAEAGE